MQQARYDIQDIYYYLKYNLYNDQAANRFLTNIIIKISILQYFPYIGSIYKDNKNRFLIYKNFLIIYEIQENEKIISIKTIIHRKTNAK